MISYSMRPQDIAILLKILCYGQKSWLNKDLAMDLFISTAEVSNSLQRSAVSGLIDDQRKKVRVQSLMEFLIYGLPYVFPIRPEGMTKGMPTAHSHPRLKTKIISDELYVWPDAEGDQRGFSIDPLYSNAVKAAQVDEKMYLFLALVDVLRIGKPRERKLAIHELENLIHEPSY